MTATVLTALRRIVADATTGADGLPRAEPRSVDQAASVLGLASERGWGVRVEGGATWMPPDAPADLVLATARLNRLQSLTPQDLVATVQAGATMTGLATTFRSHGVWLAVDPPGQPERTLGSVLATATAGPLAQRFGPVRDHVVGTTVVTADGRVVRAGGTVVKNVAGYDLSKLQAGGFGAFGLIAEVNVRLRAVPAVQRTLVARGAIDPLLDLGAAMVAGGAEPAGIELVSPGLSGSPEWTVVARFAGTREGVEADLAQARDLAASLGPAELPAGAASEAGTVLGRGALEGDVTLRMGALADSLAETLELLGQTIGLDRVSAGLVRGGIRWTGSLTAARILELRRRLAEREIPVTLERAPWTLRSMVGHFGAFREGVGRLTGRLQRVFDPGGILNVPLESATSNG